MNINKKIINKILKEAKPLYMGVRTRHNYIQDPQRLVFSLSRYKFVAKMFEGYENVLEVGAGDGFKSPIVKQHCKNLYLSDILEENLQAFKATNIKKTKFFLHNFIEGHTQKKFDGIYSLDVLEHIKKKNEKKFLKNISKSLKNNGSLIIGMPTLESQKYASKGSKLGHINCKSKNELKSILSKFFNCLYVLYE